MATHLHCDGPERSARDTDHSEDDLEHEHVPKPDLQWQSAGSQRTIQRWYNTSCFPAPTNFAFGNAGRNIIIAPGLEAWDLAPTKISG